MKLLILASDEPRLSMLIDAAAANDYKAKGIIMKSRGVDEDTAYNSIRKQAMDNNTKVYDVACRIIHAAELLL